MTKLSPSQVELLTLARFAGAGGADATRNAQTASALIKRGFLNSTPQPDGQTRFVITQAGRAAIGEPADAADAPPSASSDVTDTPAASATSKIGLLLELLRRPQGASIEDLTEATGWQAHSVRGAIAGAIKKTRGIAIVSEKGPSGRTYRAGEGSAS